ncbi:MAG: TatD family deoxyribonuclease [Gammaproteobacteria bacterium]|nr:MAG: TatD family deoxyribonuclease [Gammaproteobacteria bacterium]
MQLVDTHCHIDVEEFAHDRQEVLERAHAAGVCTLVVPSIGAFNWAAVHAVCERHPGLYPAYGLHPVYAARHHPEDVARLDAWLGEHAAVAVGEIGLDHYVPDADRARQRTLFEAQLEVAAQRDLPVLLHVRKAHDEVLACLRGRRLRGGIVHAFNGSLQQAERYLDLGFRFGFGGMLTHPRSRHLRMLATRLPLEAIVLETDAPDLTGHAHRGARNEPAWLPEVLATLAELRPEGAETIAAVTTRNAKECLGLP